MEPVMADSNDSAKPDFRVDGKVIVVTGGVGILGKVYCRALAESGGTVVVADIDQDACEALVAGLPGEHLAAPVDLADEQSIVEWSAALNDRFGAVDVLLNNAAARPPNIFAKHHEFPLDDWNQMVAVNMTAPFLTTRELGPAMADRGRGSIINVSSIYGVVGPDQRIYEGSRYEEQGGEIRTPMAYSATKGAVVSMTRYLAAYWGETGLRTNCITPGGVGSGQNSTFTEKYSDRVPMHRMARADEMAGAVLYLASDASSYVNGHNLVIDGGWTAW
jgi:NAD(P)-dependent dehydrogenase (short-subunit alcohol dehydrogenase family)